MPFADHPVRRVAAAEGIRPSGTWPHTIPAVRQLLTDGLDLDPGVTFLVGENGTGKSTLVEAIAIAFGMSPEGGSTGARLTTRASESPLSGELLLTRGAGASRWGFFLRAETMHGYYTYLENNPGPYDPKFHELSHGEGFLEVLRSRFDSPGLYCLDGLPGRARALPPAHPLARTSVARATRSSGGYSAWGGRRRRGGSGASEPSGAMCSKIWSTRLSTCGSSTV